MTISQLREMNNREFAMWFANANSNTLKEVLNNENLGGGISKFTKKDLQNVILDLIEDIVSELTLKLKPKRKTAKRKTTTKKENKSQSTKLKEKETELIQREIELNSKEKEIDKREKLVNEKEKELYSFKMQENEVKVQEIIWYEELISTIESIPMYSLKSDSKMTHYYYFTPKRWFDTIEEFDKEISNIKKKYRKMIKYFHPDNKETGDELKFRIIQEAWEVAEAENMAIREDIEDDYDMPF